MVYLKYLLIMDIKYFVCEVWVILGFCIDILCDILIYKIIFLDLLIEVKWCIKNCLKGKKNFFIKD